MPVHPNPKSDEMRWVVLSGPVAACNPRESLHVTPTQAGSDKRWDRGSTQELPNKRK